MLFQVLTQIKGTLLKESIAQDTTFQGPGSMVWSAKRVFFGL